MKKKKFTRARQIIIIKERYTKNTKVTLLKVKMNLNFVNRRPLPIEGP